MKKIISSLIFCSMLISPVFAQKMKWNKNQVIAHRGAWKNKNLPENSIAALKEAVKLKCYGSEFDVHLTADDVMVVNHDATFYGMPIAKSTYAELSAKKLTNGEELPTLENYLKAGMKQRGTKLILELKPQSMGKERDIQLAALALKLIKDLKAENWMEYISFSYDICKHIVSEMPGSAVAYLGGNVAPAVIKADGLSGIDYNYTVFEKQDWIKEAHANGLSVNVWTVNTLPQLESFLDRNVEFITTNEPELLFEILKKRTVANQSNQ